MTVMEYETEIHHPLPLHDRPNEEELLDLARWLTNEERKSRLGKPSEWNQGAWVTTDEGDNVVVEDELVFWSCGTPACAAGHVCLLDGGKPAFRSLLAGYHPVPGSRGVAESLSDSVMFFGGRPEPIDEHATRTLGLNADQAAQLFEGSNDWSSMMYRIAAILRMPRDELVTRVGGDDLPPVEEYDDDDYYEDSDD